MASKESQSGYDAFLLSLKTARIAKPTKPLPPGKLSARKNALLGAILQRTAYIEDFSRLETKNQTLESILSQVENLTFYLPNLKRHHFNPQTAIPAALSGIYRNLDRFYRNLAMRNHEIDIMWKQYFGRIKGKPAWCHKASSKLGDPLFGYMIRCQAFIFAAIDMDTYIFDRFLGIIKENEASLMVFARVRLPKIKPDDAEEIFSTYDGLSRKKDLHWYIVPEPGSGQAITPTFCNTIENNYFDPKDFYGTAHLPHEPLHPGNRYRGTKCFICKSYSFCSCEPPSALKGDLMVELHNFVDTGRGVRTLQRINYATILGEFVGVFHSTISKVDPKWALQFHNNGPNSSINNRPNAILYAGNDGNWTRFITRTEKDANVQFFLADVGKYRRILVQAIRDIKMYEKLTFIPGKKMSVQHNTCGLEKDFSNVSLVSSPLSDTVSASTLSHISLDFAAPPATDIPLAEAATEPAHTRGSFPKCWIMPTQDHSEGEGVAEYKATLPARRARQEIRNKPTEGQSENQQAEAAGRSVSAQHMNGRPDAQQRRAQKHAARRETAQWNTRWIGQEDASRPRNKAGRARAPYFAEF